MYCGHYTVFPGWFLRAQSNRQKLVSVCRTAVSESDEFRNFHLIVSYCHSLHVRKLLHHYGMPPYKNKMESYAFDIMQYIIKHSRQLPHYCNVNYRLQNTRFGAWQCTACHKATEHCEQWPLPRIRTIKRISEHQSPVAAISRLLCENNSPVIDDYVAEMLDETALYNLLLTLPLDFVAF